jgi:hypothetical protein
MGSITAYPVLTPFSYFFNFHFVGPEVKFLLWLAFYSVPVRDTIHTPLLVCCNWNIEICNRCKCLKSSLYIISIII